MNTAKYTLNLTGTAATILAGACSGFALGMKDQLRREAERATAQKARFFGLGALFFTPTPGLQHHGQMIALLDRITAELCALINDMDKAGTDLGAFYFGNASASLLQPVLISARDAFQRKPDSESNEALPLIEGMIAQLPFNNTQHASGVTSWNSVSP